MKEFGLSKHHMMGDAPDPERILSAAHASIRERPWCFSACSKQREGMLLHLLCQQLDVL